MYDHVRMLLGAVSFQPQGFSCEIRYSITEFYLSSSCIPERLSSEPNPDETGHKPYVFVLEIESAEDLISARDTYTGCGTQACACVHGILY